jgi:phenylacetate-CoA ligase
MHPALVRHVFFPLHERLKGKATYAWLRRLERSQDLEPAALADLQFQQLRRLLDFAYREVPYYRALLDEHALPPSRIASLDDFRRIPPLTKDIIRRRFRELQPRGRRRGVQRVSTGGSTGAPVTVLVDAERTAVTDASRLRAHRWFGVDIGGPEVVLWGSNIELGRQDGLRTARDWLLNSRLLSAFDLGESALARHAQALQRLKPWKVFGYASALYLLARYLQRTGWVAEPDWPRAIFATAEPLYDFQRSLIRSVLGGAVATEYGAREAGLIASECPAGGLHLNAESIMAEVDAADEHGRGELLVTHLHSFAMPIVRYRTADIAALGGDGCRCSRTLPLLGCVEGRRTDFLVTPSGRILHALSVIYVLREISEIREFQVSQERLDQLLVRLVPDGRFSSAVGTAITRKLQRLLDDTVAVHLEVVDSISHPLSGKHRYVVSHVADEFLDGLLTRVGAPRTPRSRPASESGAAAP